jgi:NADPH:quinone reductase-like Zn-dependent oxidoreductase
MRAIVITRFGGPEALELVDMPVPEPGEGEVRVRVAAATVNPADMHQRNGSLAEWLDELGLRPPFIPGMEIAGTIDAVGAGVDWRPGQQVIAIVWPYRAQGGGYAEQVVVPADSVAPAPAGWSLVQAATLPMNGLTVRLAFDLLALGPGQTLAITGAAGAVGGYAIQLGKYERLRIIADASPADEQLVRALGADIVVPRGERFAAAVREAVPGGVDAVLDAADVGAAALAAVRDGGVLAAVRPPAGESPRGIEVRRVLAYEYLHNRSALEELGRLAAAGILTPRVADVLPAENAAEAQRRREAGGLRGRLVLTF